MSYMAAPTWLTIMIFYSILQLIHRRTTQYQMAEIDAGSNYNTFSKFILIVKRNVVKLEPKNK
jgi:hypothetical protein